MEYYIIIAASLSVILSYFFNRFSSKTNIPSVLLLIILGILIKESISYFGVNKSLILNAFEEIRLLEVLGTLGLILIVLEAALELKLEKNKRGLILKSFSIALIGLLLCLFSIASIFQLIWAEISFLNALIYATPLSILSSAIVIPSVINLEKEDEEFHIYESTFSDILGIMIFYFLTSLDGEHGSSGAISTFSINLIITIALSVILSYVMIYLFQNLETKIKLFLMISVLILLFSIGKLLHLSSLLVILIFGLILNNYKLFFIGPLKKYLKPISIEKIKESFLMITIETAFVIRTFFFIIFGFSISIAALVDLEVALISLAVLVLIYLTRALSLLPFQKSRLFRTTVIAPRGLITLLLFYSIPEKFLLEEFKTGILLFVIIITSLIMISGLVNKKNSLEEEVINS